MPERLSNLQSETMIILCNAGDYPLEKRPELLPWAMRIITAWSTLEAFMSGALVKILGANATPAIAMFTAITSTAARKAALRAAAEAALDDNRHKDLFLALMRLFRSAAKERHKIAHWIWGYSPEFSDRVLLAHPAVMVNFDLDEEAGKTPIMDTKKIYAYTKRDFQNITRDIEQLSRHFLGFRHMLAASGEKADELYNQLCNEHQIHEVLLRQQGHQKTDP